MKPLILLTNDDGVYSPGLHAAASAVAELGDVIIAAPKEQQTAMARSLPKGPDVGVIEMIEVPVNGKQQPAYLICASPALTVAYTLTEIVSRKPDLCISGINYGENVGMSITISGTVCAAIEAASQRIPSIAISMETDMSMHYASDYATVNWTVAMHFTRYIAQKVLNRGLPPEVAVLNVNVPSTATDATPMRVTTQSRQNYYEYVPRTHRDFSQSYRLPIKVAIDRDTLEPTSDIQAFVFDRVISVTPLSWDLTAKMALDDWFHTFSQ